MTSLALGPSLRRTSLVRPEVDVAVAWARRTSSWAVRTWSGSVVRMNRSGWIPEVLRGPEQLDLRRRTRAASGPPRQTTSRCSPRLVGADGLEGCRRRASGASGRSPRRRSPRTGCGCRAGCWRRRSRSSGRTADAVVRHESSRHGRTGRAGGRPGAGGHAGGRRRRGQAGQACRVQPGHRHQAPEPVMLDWPSRARWAIAGKGGRSRPPARPRSRRIPTPGVAHDGRSDRGAFDQEGFAAFFFSAFRRASSSSSSSDVWRTARTSAWRR